MLENPIVPRPAPIVEIAMALPFLLVKYSPTMMRDGEKSMDAPPPMETLLDIQQGHKMSPHTFTEKFCQQIPRQSEIL